MQMANWLSYKLLTSYQTNDRQLIRQMTDWVSEKLQTGFHANKETGFHTSD